jgi:hypothetical protein
MADLKDDLADRFVAAAEKLERAAAHCLIAARHYQDRNVPRGCAHAFAALGDMQIASDTILENARVHAGRARIDTDPPIAPGTP